MNKIPGNFRSATWSVIIMSKNIFKWHINQCTKWQVFICVVTIDSNCYCSLVIRPPSDSVGLRPDSVGLLPDSGRTPAGLRPDSVGLLPDSCRTPAGLRPDSVGLLPDSAGLRRTPAGLRRTQTAYSELAGILRRLRWNWIASLCG